MLHSRSASDAPVEAGLLEGLEAGVLKVRQEDGVVHVPERIEVGHADVHDGLRYGPVSGYGACH